MPSWTKEQEEAIEQYNFEDPDEDDNNKKTQPAKVNKQPAKSEKQPAKAAKQTGQRRLQRLVSSSRTQQPLV